MNRTSRPPGSSRRFGTLGFGAGQHYNGAHAGRKQTPLSVPPPPAPEPDGITREQFDSLLDWLDSDRERAGERYKSIHKRLIKIFMGRGSPAPEELADETMNRVARLASKVRPTYTGDPAHYILSVARFIFMESLHKNKVPSIGKLLPPVKTDVKADEDDSVYACLEECLSKLPANDRELVLNYYREEKQAKIDGRKRLAEQMGLAMNALRIRAFRIRAALQDCVEGCREREGQVKRNVGNRYSGEGFNAI
jgi:DNA-directed RNA polymerase specialized sigma24 family protein